MSIIFRDFGTAYLAAPLSAGATSLTVDNPAWLPSLQTGDYFYLVLQKYADRSYVEIVKVTATSGAVCTVVRAQSGTAARSFAVGDYAELRLTTDSLVEFIAQNIATKMDKFGGGDFVGNYRFLNVNTPRIDLVRTADNVIASVLTDFSATEGHRTIIGGGAGANAVTPSILLRPNGYGNSTGQLLVDKDGLVDVVACIMRGAQRTEAGAAVRYDYLDNFVPATRKVNGRELSADVTLTPSDVKAAPEGFGLGETQAFTVADMDSDPLTWNGGEMGWIRAISSSTGKPDDQAGVGLLHRYQSGASSIAHVLFFGHNNKMYTRRWSGTAWSVWKASFDSTNKPAISDVIGLSDALVAAQNKISALEAASDKHYFYGRGFDTVTIGAESSVLPAVSVVKSSRGITQHANRQGVTVTKKGRYRVTYSYDLEPTGYVQNTTLTVYAGKSPGVVGDVVAYRYTPVTATVVMVPLVYTEVFSLEAGDDVYFRVSTVNNTSARVWRLGYFQVEEL